MVFEKEPRRNYCEICQGEHNEEHKAYKLEQSIVKLTGTGKILPGLVLIAIFFLLFSFALSYTDVANNFYQLFS